MDFYDITQSFSTDEATLDYLRLVELEIETTLLDLEEVCLANTLEIKHCQDKLCAPSDAFDKYRYTATKETAEKRISLTKRKLQLHVSMLGRVRRRMDLLKVADDTRIIPEAN